LNSNESIRRAVLAVLGAGSAATVFAPQVLAADAAASADTMGIEEVVVTATRRAENIQDVPITIQAMSGETLAKLNVTSLNELLKYTPNVTYSGNGPGSGNIFVRGLSSGGAPNQSQSTIAPFPNVALYLDEESMQFPGRNVDVYLVDMERVEVLEGPQGTLFGGGAQAGALRYITNKPNLNTTSGNVNASYGVTAGGDPNNSLNATFNLPLIDGKMAVRATIFSDHHGGYIDNVRGTIAVPAVPVQFLANGVTPDPAQSPPARPGSPSAGNGKLAGPNLNTVQYTGGRISLAYKFNDDWDMLLQQNYQQFNADGYFNTEPVSPVSNEFPKGKALGPYQIMAFSPNYDRDNYQSTAWTLNGKLGEYLKAVYTGSYMTRHTDQSQDYSNYLTSRHGSYYACSGKGAGYSYFRSAKATTCYAPIGSWRDEVENSHLSHELRLTTPVDYRLRGTFGAFYEDFSIKDDMNFNYLGMPQCDPTNLAISAAGGPDCTMAVGTQPGYWAWHPGLRLDSNTAFGEDVRRGYQQTAYFASVDFDIIPKVLTVTGGMRHYSYDEFEKGSEYYSATSTILNVPNGNDNHAGFGINLKKSESGTKYRGNLTWHVNSDVLAYYTYSEGFRPGGFNRTATNIDGSKISLKGIAPYLKGVSATRQATKPVGFESDNLVNNEIGLKSEWLNHRLQINVSAYVMDWKDVQLPLFDPVHLGNTTFVVNGPTYQVKGAELQFTARVTPELTVQGSASYNKTKQTNAPCLQSNKVSATNPTPIGQCITQINGLPYDNPFGVLGTSPPYSPELQYNVRAHYDWNMGDYKPFWGLGVNYTDSMRNQPASFPDGNDPAYNPPTTTLLKYTMPSYTTVDASIGTSKDNWTAQLSVNNLTNNDASTGTTSGQFIKSVLPLRPRVITLEFGFKF
jgi:iron complex outermembrane receptor protein